MCYIYVTNKLKNHTISKLDIAYICRFSKPEMIKYIIDKGAI